jgi:hypothetical protein
MRGTIPLRLILRILALVCLSVAVISAVVDAARSLSATNLVLTSLLKGWSTVAPSSLSFIQSIFQDYLPAFISGTALNFVLNMPAAAVFAVLAALLYSVGAKRAKPFGQIGYQ